MVDTDLIADGRYELLEGEIVKITLSEPHTFVHTELTRELVECFGWDYVRVLGSLAIDEHSEPQPDVAVTRQPADAYLASGIPPGSEFRLVVEVSDSTLWRDRGQKARLYAAAGVPEYWVVNVTGRTVIVYREPVGDEYRSIVTHDESRSLTPIAAPESTIAIASFLPPTAIDTK